MALSFVLRHRRAVVLTTTLAALCAGSIADSCSAQAATGQTTTTPASGGNGQASGSAATARPAHHKHHSAKPDSKPEVVETPPPPPPPPPDWPVNDKAQPASVDWNGRDLRIAATNSSLEQILKDVSTATGVEVDGLASDQRIFGSYGPAPAREVLNQLLDGSGYNVMMIGDKGEGTPRSLVLSDKGAGATHAPAANARSNRPADEEPPDDPEPVEQPQPQPGEGARHPVPQLDPNANRTPQQIMQEMQQRQQQLQQQNSQPQQPPQGQPIPQSPNE